MLLSCRVALPLILSLSSITAHRVILYIVIKLGNILVTSIMLVFKKMEGITG